MNQAVAIGGPRAVVASRLLSLREAVVLADVPEKEKCVRKDIDSGVLSGARVIAYCDSRLRVAWGSVVAFAAVYKNELLVDSAPFRKAAFDKVLLASMDVEADYFDEFNEFVSRWVCPDATIDIDTYVTIPLGRVCASVRPRLAQYAGGLSRVEEKDKIMGGAAVFRGSRLPVHHVAQMVEDGERVDNILADYSYLTKADVDFACLYSRARPLIGRPRVGGDRDYALDA